jgi:hypothetical protein
MLREELLFGSYFQQKQLDVTEIQLQGTLTHTQDDYLLGRCVTLAVASLKRRLTYIRTHSSASQITATLIAAGFRKLTGIGCS